MKTKDALQQNVKIGEHKCMSKSMKLISNRNGKETLVYMHYSSVFIYLKCRTRVLEVPLLHHWLSHQWRSWRRHTGAV